MTEAATPIEWGIVEEGYSSQQLAKYATLFFQGNGYIGVRGGFEESALPERGVFINGFYETEGLNFSETAYGYAKKRQAIVPLPDAGIIYLTVNGEPLGKAEFR